MPFFCSLEGQFGYGRPQQTFSNVQTSNLILWVDAANTSSYPGSGTNWNNLVSLNSSYRYLLQNSLTTSNIGSTKGMSFDGINKYSVNNINLQSFLVSSGSNETREMWFYWRGGNSVLLTELGTTTPNADWHDAQIMLSNTSIIFSVWQNNVGMTPYPVYNTLQTNTWYHLVFQYRNSTSLMMAYVNGIQTFSNTVSRTYNGTNYFLALGAGDTTTVGTLSNYYNGLVSIYRWYNSIVSSNDIFNNYLSEKGRFGL
jgi:hypothetical protein